jgi:hypothetical protein
MCMFHKWAKWEDYTVDMIKIDLRSSKEYPYQNFCQKRHCEKCNKVQHKVVKEGC